MNHAKVASDILRAVGGKENVNNLVSCVTRVRFKLKDENIADREGIKNIDGVISIIERGGLFQVVLGDQVTPVYNEIQKLVGGSEGISSENDGNDEKEKLFDKVTQMISGSFAPILGILGATGTLKGILALLTVTGVLDKTSGSFIVLNAIGDVLFYFFPIFLGATTARHFKINQYLGMAIGGAIMYPSIVELAATNPDITFLGLPMQLLNYASSVFPIIISVWLASILEKYVKKIVPKSIEFLLTPFFVLIIIVPLVLFIVGPVLTTLSGWLSDATVAIYDFNPIIGGLVLGGPWLLIVMFGIHWAFIPIFINNVAIMGSDGMLGLLTANMFALAAAAVVVALKSKNDEKMKNMSWSSAGVCLLGVAEPAIYGVLLPQKTPFIMAIIGGSIGGAVAGFFGSRLYAFGGSGLLQLPLAINPEGIDIGFWGSILSCVIAFVVTFILTNIFYKPRDAKKLNSEYAA